MDISIRTINYFVYAEIDDKVTTGNEYSLVYNKKNNEFIIYDMDKKSKFIRHDLLDHSTMSEEELFQASTVYNLKIPIKSLIVLQEYVKNYSTAFSINISIDDITNKVQVL